MNFLPFKKDHCPFANFLRKHLCSKEKHLERERDLIQLAHQMVNEEGFSTLNMDKLAAKSAYSKGTIYNHFNSKEDLISALAIYGLTTLNELMEKSFTFEGTTREKCLAAHYAYLLYSRMEPTLFSCAITATTPSVIEKSSQWRLDGIRELDQNISGVGMRVMTTAIANKELPESVSDKLASITFANWALGFGSITLMNSPLISEILSEAKSRMPLLANINFLLDGMGWQLYSTEFDYELTWARIEKELFAEEVTQLGA